MKAMGAPGLRSTAALLAALAMSCSESTTGATRATDPTPDSGATDGSVSGSGGAADAGSDDARAGGASGVTEGGAGDGPPDAGAPLDAASTRDGWAASDGASTLCVPPPSAIPSADAGTCLGIYYATVARLEVWIDDASLPGGGARAWLSRGDTRTIGGHAYGYSGHSLITSGSRVDLFLDVDGRKDAIEIHLGGCAPEVGPRAWDYPATFSRSPCAGCAPASIGRHYAVAERPVDGGLDYTFTADEPPRTCGAGIDLLGFSTWP